MLPAILLILALLLAALGSLTTLRVPVWVEWRLALFAGEYGHWVAPVAMAIAAVALTLARQSVVGLAAAIVAMVAAGLLLKPVMQAAGLARTLPSRLETAFGNGGIARSALSLPTLFAGAPAARPFRTLEAAPGLPLDFYRPEGEGPVPCVIVIHGGGWDSGDRTQLPQFNHWLVSQGYAVAAISYRLAPAHPWPAQRDDTLAAIAFLKKEADQLGIDASRLVMLGRSAGGQIAAAVGYGADDPAIRGVVALYAPHDMRFVWSIAREDDALNSTKLMRQFLGGGPQGRESVYDTASAQLLVRRGRTPPTLLVHGVIDTLVWQRHSERLAARLSEEGVPHVNLALPWAVHAFEYNLSGPGGQLTTFAIDHFLAQVTAR